nr:hypothetical protein [Tanacetum cinerariifolium]
MAQQPQQQVIPTDQLVTTKYQSIERCKIYALLQNISCSAKCKIVEILLVDHALSHALTATADVPVQKKDSIQYPCLTKLIIADLMKKFPSISPRLEENYHSIKDDVPLGSVYTTGNVAIQGMLIPSELLTNEIRATKEYKAYVEKFVRTPTLTTEKKRKSKEVARESGTLRKSLKVTTKQKKPSATTIPPPSDDRERDEIAEATILSLIMHKTALVAKAQENVAIVKEKILEEDIEKMIDGEDGDSYASAFPDLKDDEKDDDDEDVDNYDHDDHALKKMSGSSNIRNEKMQTPIPSPLRSHGKDFSSDKTVLGELIVVSPTPDITSKETTMLQPTSSSHKILSCKMKEMSDTLNIIVLELTVDKTNELRKEAIPRMANYVVNKDREIFVDVFPELIAREFATHAPNILEELFKGYIKNKVLNFHPTTSIPTKKTTADLKQQLYLTMKSNLQAQAADLEMWHILKKKFKKSSASASLGKQKKDSIQYPCLTKLIIADLMKKFPSISPRLEENYHSIKDDVPLGSVYTTGNVTIQGMLIPSELLTNEIRATKEYKAKLRATRTPTPTTKKKRKRKEVAREFGTLRKSLKVTTKQKKPSATTIPPPSDDRERDEIAEATILSLIMHKTTLVAKAQENVAVVKEKILEEDIEKMIDGEDGDSYASAFPDSKDDEKDDDDEDVDNYDHDDHALKKMSELTVDKTNELRKEAILRMANYVVNKDREIFVDVFPELIAKEFATHAPNILKELFKGYIKNKVLNFHPTTSIPTKKTTADLKQQLYLIMKSNLQAQAADLEMWHILKKKFKKSFASASLGKVHNAHQRN